MSQRPGFPEKKRQEPAFRVSPFTNKKQSDRFGLLIRAIEALIRPYRIYDLSMEAGGLSEALSRSRGSTVRQEYLADELTQAAYCAHFLPWNIYRLLLSWRSSPPAALMEGAVNDKLLIDDWGCGPMVGLLALWVACGEPALKGATYRAYEKQRDILIWGDRIVKSVGVQRSVRIEFHNHNLDFDDEDHGPCDLLIVSNAFNEWLPPRGRSDESIRSFARVADQHLTAKGELLLMEPATRVVSWGVMVLRDVLIERQLKILAPCTHHNTCPLLDRKLKTWCHFRQPIEIHPVHKSLADAIRIDRDTLSYSYLHVARQARSVEVPEKTSLARIVSDPIMVEGGRAVYACASKGRVQLENRSRNWSPELHEVLGQDKRVLFRYPAKLKKDAKSWAPRIPLEKVRREDGSVLEVAPPKDDKPSQSGQ